MHLILLGPLENKVNDKRTGGAIVQFKHIISELSDRGIAYTVIDTNKHNYRSKIVAFFSVIIKYFALVRSNTTVLYFTSSNYTYFLPVFGQLKKLFGNKLFVRKIGGDIGHFNEEAQKFNRAIKLLKKADCVLVETKGLQQLLIQNGINCIQFLNARKKSETEDSESPKNLAYFGRVSRSKGLMALVEIDDLLPPNLCIDIYGPIEDVSEVSFKDLNNIHYKGSLSPDEVPNTLTKYKATILPTKFYGEGHPGIIVESLMNGRPVITTNWHYINELVKDEYNGVLFQSAETSQILEAINKFNSLPFEELVNNSKSSVEDYDIESNVNHLLQTIGILEVTQSKA